MIKILAVFGKEKTVVAVVVLILLTLIPSAPSVGFRISRDGVRLNTNFHEVDFMKFYRSAQLDAEELSAVIHRYGIRTVINLQGERPGVDWYEQEREVTQKLGIHFVNLSMATESIPKREDLVSLLEVYAKTERPILVHCRSGADRTGEAVAVYQMEYMGVPKEIAHESLSLRYLHVKAFAPAKKYFVDLYQGAKWALESFDHCDPKYQYSDRRHCPTSNFLCESSGQCLTDRSPSQHF